MSATSQIRLSSAYSLGKQRRAAHFVNDNRLNHVPGAGKYDPPTTDKTSKTVKVPSWSMSKASRFDNFKPLTPGPGSYEIKSKGVEGPRFTTRCKPGINAELLASGLHATPYKMRTKPDPGSYNFPVDGPFKKLSYSMNGINEKVIKGTDASW